MKNCFEYKKQSMDRNKTLKIYNTYIRKSKYPTEELINTLYSLAHNELDKNPNEPYISACRVRRGCLMIGQDGESYVCAVRLNSNHYWKKLE